MGISTTANRQSFVGTGSQTAFSFSLPFFNQVDLNVYLWDTIAGGVTPLVLNNVGPYGFSISGTLVNGAYYNGATITLVTAPPSTTNIVVVRNPSPVQNFALLQNGNISSQALVQQFDYMTLLIQRMQDQLNNAILMPDGVASSPAFSGQLPSNTPIQGVNAEAFLQLNASADGMQLSPSGPNFSPLSFGYNAFQTAATVIQIPLLTLPAQCVLNKLFIKSTAAFAGTSITDVQAAVGISGNYGLFFPDYDVYSAPSDTNFDSSLVNYLGSFVNTTQIYLQLTSVGANLSALSAGALSIWYSTSFLV